MLKIKEELEKLIRITLDKMGLYYMSEKVSTSKHADFQYNECLKSNHTEKQK